MTSVSSSESRRRRFAAGALAVAALLGATWIARLDFGRKVSTDVLDLLPAKERAPELQLVRALASDAEARVMLFLIDGENAAPAAQRFAAELAKSPAFVQALSLDDPAARNAAGAALFEHRFELLFPIWLHERERERSTASGSVPSLSAWLAGRAAERLEFFLREPASLPFQDLVPSDPLLLIPDAVNRLRGAVAVVQPPATDQPSGRVWAQIAASPMQDPGQEPVFAAIDAAWQSTRAGFPGLRISDTGVNRLAAASKARIRAELSWLNTLSLAAVLAVAILFVRRLQRTFHLIPPVLFAILGAWVATTAVFERVHILVFVLGALLTGVAIDYGFYLFMPAPGGEPEEFGTKVRRLMKPLFSSCFTAVAGFALLVFSELPLIRQLGFFVGAGLVCALVSALAWFSLLDNTVLEIRRWPARRFSSGRAPRGLRLAVAALWLAALPGLAWVSWTDDVRALEIPAPGLRAADARIRTAFGQDPSLTAFLTRGDSLLDARNALERFQDWLGKERPAAELASAGAVVPTEAEHLNAVSFVREQTGFPAELRRTLETAGFELAAFDGFFAAYARYAAAAGSLDLGAEVTSWQRKLTGPASLLVHPGESLSWYVTLVRNAPAGAPPPETRTLAAGQLQSLNRIFGSYRRSAMWLSFIGLGVVGAGVLLCYGFADGLRIFAIPAGTCLGLFGVLGWLGLPLNLFHLLGAFLGVCLTHNYSIFSAPATLQNDPPALSVRMSALTTASSFGVLMLSGIPAVRALGLTVTAMVLAAALAIEFRLTGSARDRDSGSNPRYP